jgi:hypothetical protein
VEYFEGCPGIIDELDPGERQGFENLHINCKELQATAAAMLGDARPAMIFHVLVVNDAPPILGPIGPLPSPSPSPPTSTGAEAAEEFRRVCTTGNLATCVPQCSALTYGFLLSISIDGRGTVLTCNKIDGKFSWQGQASLGGYIGADILSLVSALVSGAAGTYLGTVMEDAGVLADLAIEPAQLVLLVGLRSLAAAPSWGSGSFTIQERSSLTLEFVSLMGSITMARGALAVTLIRCVVANSVFLGGLSVPEGGKLTLEGPMALRNTNIIAIGTTSLGKVSLAGGVTVQYPDGSTPIVSGQLPGTMTAELDGQVIGTVSRAADGTVTVTTGGNHEGASAETDGHDCGFAELGSVQEVQGSPCASGRPGFSGTGADLLQRCKDECAACPKCGGFFFNPDSSCNLNEDFTGAPMAFRDASSTPSTSAFYVNSRATPCKEWKGTPPVHELNMANLPLESWQSPVANADGKSFTLFLMPPKYECFGHVAYANICLSAALQPVVGSMTSGPTDSKTLCRADGFGACVTLPPDSVTHGLERNNNGGYYLGWIHEMTGWNDFGVADSTSGGPSRDIFFSNITIPPWHDRDCSGLTQNLEGQPIVHAICGSAV